MSRYINISLIGLFLLFSCTNGKTDCFRRAKSESSEYRLQGNIIHSVELRTLADVVLIADGNHYIEVTYDKNLIDRIETSLDSTHLVIDNLENCRFARHLDNKPTVKVHFDTIKSLVYNGNGIITAIGTNYCNNFTIDSYTGGRSISLNLSTSDTEIRLHSGSTDISLLGETKDLYIFQRGSGFIDTEFFTSKSALLDHAGNGDTKMYVTDTISFQLESMGNLFLKGKPTLSKSIQNGSGRLYRLN